MSETIHLIEPTLRDQTGHCFGYDDVVTQYAEQHHLQFIIWAGKGAENLTFKNKHNQIKAHFIYKFRKLQLYFLYRKLIKQQAKIFVPTAGRLDLVMLMNLLKNVSYPHKIFLHFHQFTVSAKKQALLQELANLPTSQQLVIMTTTHQLATIFTSAGFKHVVVLPCPVPRPDTTDFTAPASEPTLLYAGAARADKGFPTVVELLEWLEKNNKTIPVRLQISSSHSGRVDVQTQNALTKLTTLHYEHLNICAETLDQKAYQQQFNDTICLFLYDAKAYADKFSGATLDALLAGAPIITVTNTWMGEVACEFNAGIALENLAMENVYQAIETIYQNYAAYQVCARQAAEILWERHHPKHTLKILEST